ncbi:hypothetical protein V5O48_008050 [Marasmius crinis-equi]|uniref:Uncharacterized protein n=1 Tax=Marasmius crinis-equi TaxID=585013 RepID=A0ABR3FEY0_9AGAR
MSPRSVLHSTHANPNHKPQDPPSLHGFWPYFGLISVVGIASAAVLYAMYSCYHSAGLKEQARIRCTPFEGFEMEKETQDGLDKGLKCRKEREPGTGPRRFGKWAIFSRERSESTLEAKSRPATSTSDGSEYSKLSHSATNSPILPLPIIYDPAGDPSPGSSCSSTVSSPEPPYSPPLGLGLHRTTTFDRNSIPFINPNQILHGRVNPKLGPIGGSFAFLTDTPLSGGFPIINEKIESGTEVPQSPVRGSPKRKAVDENELAHSRPIHMELQPMSRHIVPLGFSAAINAPATSGIPGSRNNPPEKSAHRVMAQGQNGKGGYLQLARVTRSNT